LLERAYPCYLLLGNLETDDFTVMAFPGGPLPEDYLPRGLRMIGAAGIVEGKLASVFLIPLDPKAVDVLAAQVTERLDAVVKRLFANPEIAERAEAAAFASFMEHLTSLSDPRSVGADGTGGKR
jgi:hypothetical protein